MDYRFWVSKVSCRGRLDFVKRKRVRAVFLDIQHSDTLTFDKAFVGVVGISMGSFMTLVIV